MNGTMQRIKGFLVQEDGPTATEYAILLALIIVVAIGAISLFGLNLNATFGLINTAVTGGS